MISKSINLYTLILFVMTLLLGTSCSGIKEVNNKLTVAVSILPQETYVKAVAGDLVDVVTMIPPGASPANYQPKPNEMVKLSEASLYFAIDVPTEIANIIPNIDSINSNIKVIDLAEKVDQVYPARFFNEDDHDEDENHKDEDHEDEGHEGEDHDGHSHEGRDPPHIWMSPKRVVVMVEAIKDSLVEIDPNNIEAYERNAAAI